MARDRILVLELEILKVLIGSLRLRLLRLQVDKLASHGPGSRGSGRGAGGGPASESESVVRFEARDRTLFQFLC